MLQETFRGRGLLRTLFLVPYALPVYAAVITWAFMFQHDNGLVNHVLHDQLRLTDKPSFWLIGDNSFIALLVVSVWKSWPFAFLIVMAGLQNIPRELYEAAVDRRRRHLAADPHDHPAVAAPGQPGAGPGPVPVDVQRLQHAVRAVRQVGAGGGGPDLHPHLPVVVRHLELRHRLGDVRPAAAVPAPGDGRLPAAHLPRKEGPPMSSSTVARVGPRSPMAPPQSFLWTRRIVLTLLAGFVLLPVYVMVSSSLKPLQDVTGKFQWIPQRPHDPPVHRHLDDRPAREVLRELADRGGRGDGLLGGRSRSSPPTRSAATGSAASGSSPSPCCPPRCSPASSSCCRCS